MRCQTPFLVLSVLLLNAGCAKSAGYFSGSNETYDMNKLEELMDGFLLFEGDNITDKDWDTLSSNLFTINQDRSPYFVSVVYSEMDISLTWEFIQLYDKDFGVFSAQKSHAFRGDWSVCDDCVVISLCAMNNITVDQDNGLITVQPSIQHVVLTAYLEDYGIVLPPSNCQLCVLGGFPQGGGFGFLTKKFGTTCDFIESARVMLADGKFIDAPADLLWALRGGGGGIFGIISSFTFRTIDIEVDYPDMYEDGVTRFQIWYKYWGNGQDGLTDVMQVWADYNAIGSDVSVFLFYFPQLITDSSDSYYKIRLTALHLGSKKAAYEFLDDVLNRTSTLSPYLVNVYNESLWDGLIGNMGASRGAPRPSSTRYMTMGETPDSDVFDYLQDSIDDAFDLFDYNMSAKWIMFVRSRNSNKRNQFADHTAMPWNQYNEMYEISYGPSWGDVDTDNRRDMAEDASQAMIDSFEDDQGWYHTYLNTPDTDVDLKDDDNWEFQYYGYKKNKDQDQNEILERLRCLKLKYDPDSAFDTTYPIDPEKCDEDSEEGDGANGHVYSLFTRTVVMLIVCVVYF